MSARYRLVHYVADPAVDGRVPIAALVDVQGRIAVVRVPHIPGPKCLGGQERSAVVQMILEDLADAETFAELPPSVGPHAVLGTERNVPGQVGDPVTWVERLVAGSVETTSEAEHHRSPSRGRYGYQFFETYNVASYVKKTFDPGRDANGFLMQARPLGEVTHFVDGQRTTLLMEPILATRQSDVSKVARLFGAYRSVMTAEQRKRATLIVYVLSSGTRSRREDAIATLRDFADQVVDTAADSARASFLARIRDVGKSKAEPLLS
jgi:hypothetical protein